MYLKLTGALLVGLSGAALGFYYSLFDKYRIQELLEFKKALLILSSEIEYMRTALPEAAAHIALKTAEPVSGVFRHFSEALESNETETAYQLWAHALGRRKKGFFLAEEDFTQLNGFGKTLGYLDKEMQLNAIGLAVEYINAKVNALQANSDKNVRMYRSLGLLGGLLLAVVLW
jgi:stage III sporulation protein AB